MIPLRRRLLLAVASLVACPVARAQVSPLDAIPVYLVPLADFPEDLAGALAKSMSQDLGLRVKSSLRLPPLTIETLPGSKQLVAEDILLQGAQASAHLPDMTPKTYRLFLTTKDINARSANFRYQFSYHDTSLRCSVVSLARLVEYVDERPVLTNRALGRLLKMTKRAIGEMYLGWHRSTDPNDVMFAPLMSMDDLDRMGSDHTEGGKEKPEAPVPKTPSNSA
jgi:predicted Zn-dependent protease